MVGLSQPLPRVLPIVAYCAMVSVCLDAAGTLRGASQFVRTGLGSGVRDGPSKRHNDVTGIDVDAHALTA